MDAAEEELRNSLVTFIGGTRPVVTPKQVAGYLNRHHGIAIGETLVRCYKADSFLVSFNDVRLADQVLHFPPSVGADLVLFFGHYHRQTGALFSPLRFKVLLALKNISMHVWSREIAHVVVSSSCLIYDTAPGTAAWAVQLDLVPAEAG
jgi:hypothetical protein